jgi:hypothetical protein
MFPFAPAPARIRARGQPRNSQMHPRETMIAPALRVCITIPAIRNTLAQFRVISFPRTLFPYRQHLQVSPEYLEPMS